MKIEEYLETLDKKEIIYILLSIPIAIFIIYYNFIFPKLEEKNKELEKLEKTTQQKLYDVSLQIRKVKGSKNILLPTRQKLEQLREEDRYLSYSFNTLDFIKLDSKKIYQILTELLNKANSLKLLTSFEVEWNKKKFPPFEQVIAVRIIGSGNYKEIIEYLQYIDHLKTLINISSTKIATFLDKDNKPNLTLKKKKKADLSSLSFILTKYSDNTILYLKNLAKTRRLNISINIDKLNPSYLDISYSGDYQTIRSVLQLLKNTQKPKKKLFVFTHLRANLKFVNKTKSEEKQQHFVIVLEMVGIK